MEEFLWVEKYRPKTVDDVSHQDEVIRTLKSSIASGNVRTVMMAACAGARAMRRGGRGLRVPARFVLRVALSLVSKQLTPSFSPF